MKVSLLRSYRSKNGNVTFVYVVTGSESQLAEYADAQGEHYREDDTTGKALWFTTRCIGDDGTLIITTNGNVVPDMSEFDKQASLVEQFGGNFGEALANAAVANLLGTKAAPASAPAKSAPIAKQEIASESEDEDGLGEG